MGSKVKWLYFFTGIIFFSSCQRTVEVTRDVKVIEAQLSQIIRLKSDVDIKGVEKKVEGSVFGFAIVEDIKLEASIFRSEIDWWSESYDVSVGEMLKALLRANFENESLTEEIVNTGAIELKVGRIITETFKYDVYYSDSDETILVYWR